MAYAGVNCAYPCVARFTTDPYGRLVILPFACQPYQAATATTTATATVAGAVANHSISSFTSFSSFSSFSPSSTWTSIHPNLPPVPLGFPPPPPPPPPPQLFPSLISTCSAILPPPPVISPAQLASSFSSFGLPSAALENLRRQFAFFSSTTPLAHGTLPAVLPAMAETGGRRPPPETLEAAAQPTEAFTARARAGAGAGGAPQETESATATASREEQRHRATKFRFKSKKSSSRHSRSGVRDEPSEAGTSSSSKHRLSPSPSSSPHRHRHRHRHRNDEDDDDRNGEDGEDEEDNHHHKRHRHRHSHHCHHRSHRSKSKPPSPSTSHHANAAADDPFARPLDPEAAFRESLFDAMADDEGAAYWEGVYGQPIHEYAREAEAAHSHRGDDNNRGPLEKMTDDEYADYVRQRMWERTHAGQREARARRAREREERERAERRAAEVAAEVERSLRKGQERRARRVWRDRWERYVSAWRGWEKDGGGVAGIPWPVAVVSNPTTAGAGAGGQEGGDGNGDGYEVPLETGKKGGEGETRPQITEETVREFFARGLRADDPPEADFAARLKEERVRWHPDKMQQRLGGAVDARAMRDITAVFQIVDKLWNEVRAERDKEKR